jgi:alpha-D-xyloside xylohydrolase
LVRDGTVLPHITLAQSTLQMDWSHLEMVVYAKEQSTAHGLVCLPSDNQLRELSLSRQAGSFQWAADPLGGKVTSNIRSYTDR